MTDAAMTPEVTIVPANDASWEWLVERLSTFWRWLTGDTPPPRPDTYRVGDETDKPPWHPGDDHRVDGGGVL
jgi:hypothetical protein